MDELNKLRDMLCKELEEYGSKGEMTAGSLDVVDKLAHALKNLDKIIDGEGYSGYMPYSYRNDYRSYAPRRDSMGRYSRGYSRGSGLAEELRGLMHDAPNDGIRKDIQRLAEKVEQM